MKLKSVWLSILAMGLAGAQSVPALAQTKVQIVDVRGEEPPIYCRNQHDYDNRLTALFADSSETADHFRMKNRQVSVQGHDLVIQAQVVFLACRQTSQGYGWVAHSVSQLDHYNLVAAPVDALSGSVAGYLTPINPHTGQVTVKVPVEKYLTNAADLAAFHAGKPVRGVEIYMTYLSPDMGFIRQGDENPAIRLIVDIIP